MSMKTNWKSIRSAPKDGTKILIYDPNSVSHIFAGWWDKEFDIDDRMRAKGAWTDGAALSFGYEETKSYKPTHWMPLPEPPPA